MKRQHDGERVIGYASRIRRAGLRKKWERGLDGLHFFPTQGARGTDASIPFGWLKRTRKVSLVLIVSPLLHTTYTNGKHSQKRSAALARPGLAPG